MFLFWIATCRYSKEENIKMTDPKLLHFTHLLVEQKGKYFYENEDMRRTHEILDTINCFSNIGVEYRSVFPIKIKTRPCVIILQRKLDIVPPTLHTPVSSSSSSSAQSPSIKSTTASNIDQKAANLQMDESTNGNDDQSDEKNDSDADDDDESRESNENIAEDEADRNEGVKTEATATEDDNYYSENAKDTENADDTDTETDNDDNPSQDDTLDAADNNDDDQNIVETELKRPSKETKLKLKKLIEKHYRTRAARLPPNDQTDLAAAAVNRPSIRSNIKQIIKKEKIKEVIERISQIDLRTVCDLERESTKQCLLKVIDSFIE